MNTKKSGIGKHKGLDEYANGIEIFSDYLSMPEWNEETIKTRTQMLCDHATEDVWLI